MECPAKTEKSMEIVLDYVAGMLTPAAQIEFEKHLQDCADCRVVVKAQQDVWETLDQWAPAGAVPEVSPEFDARVYARIAQEDAAPLWKRMWWRMSSPAVTISLWKPLVPLAAACAVLAVGLAI